MWQHGNTYAAAKAVCFVIVLINIRSTQPDFPLILPFALCLVWMAPVYLVFLTVFLPPLEVELEIDKRNSEVNSLNTSVGSMGSLEHGLELGRKLPVTQPSLKPAVVVRAQQAAAALVVSMLACFTIGFVYEVESLYAMGVLESMQFGVVIAIHRSWVVLQYFTLLLREVRALGLPAPFNHMNLVRLHAVPTKSPDTVNDREEVHIASSMAMVYTTDTNHHPKTQSGSQSQLPGAVSISREMRGSGDKKVRYVVLRWRLSPASPHAPRCTLQLRCGSSVLAAAAGLFRLLQGCNGRVELNDPAFTASGSNIFCSNEHFARAVMCQDLRSTWVDFGKSKLGAGTLHCTALH